MSCNTMNLIYILYIHFLYTHIYTYFLGCLNVMLIFLSTVSMQFCLMSQQINLFSI